MIPLLSILTGLASQEKPGATTPLPEGEQPIPEILTEIPTNEVIFGEFLIDGEAAKPLPAPAAPQPVEIEADIEVDIEVEAAPAETIAESPELEVEVAQPEQPLPVARPAKPDDTDFVIFPWMNTQPRPLPNVPVQAAIPLVPTQPEFSESPELERFVVQPDPVEAIPLAPKFTADPAPETAQPAVPVSTTTVTPVPVEIPVRTATTVQPTNTRPQTPARPISAAPVIDAPDVTPKAEIATDAPDSAPEIEAAPASTTQFTARKSDAPEPTQPAVRTRAPQPVQAAAQPVPQTTQEPARPEARQQLVEAAAPTTETPPVAAAPLRQIAEPRKQASEARQPDTAPKIEQPTAPTPPSFERSATPDPVETVTPDTQPFTPEDAPQDSRAEPAVFDLRQSERLETTAPRMATRAEQPVHRQVAEQLAIQLTGKDGTTEISLAPEELGRVRMSVQHGEQGTSITIWAERPETLSLMRRNADSLMADLQQRGFGNAHLEFSGNGQSGTGSGQQTPRPAFGLTGDTQTNPQAAAIAATTPTAQGRLDIRI